MKRILLLGKFVILWALFLNAQESATLRIGEVDVSGYNKGDKIIVPVYCDVHTGKIAAFQLYIAYDHSVLTFQKTSYINPKFQKDCIENNTENFWTANWMGDNIEEISLNQNEKIFELEFIYQGGQTDLEWETEQVVKDRVIVKGETMVINAIPEEFEVNLINGCVCNPEKE